MTNISKKFFEFYDEFGRQCFLKKATRKDYHQFLEINHCPFYLLNGKIIALPRFTQTQKMIDNIQKLFPKEYVSYQKLNVPFDKYNELKPHLSLYHKKYKSAKYPMIVLETTDNFDDEFIKQKIELYKTKLSTKEICLICVDRKEIKMYQRYKNCWQEFCYKNDEVFEFKSIGLTLTVDDIYHQVILNAT